MVVPVQEDQRLLPEHDEHGVAQLGNLRHGEEVAPEGRNRVVLDETAGREGRLCIDHTKNLKQNCFLCK